MTEQAGEGWGARLRTLLGVGARDGAATAGGLDRPFVRGDWRRTSLKFTETETQSRMLRWRPDELLIAYTRTMLGALLWQPAPERIGLVGLGGGSQVKFLHRHFPDAQVEAIENNPAVIALRRRFRIPDDGPRLRITQGDAAEVLRERRGMYDLLLVDGYDSTGIPAVLSTQGFYDDCAAALAPGGAYAGNLFCDDAGHHVARLRRSFGKRVLVLDEASMSNRVAFAWSADAGVPAAGDAERLGAALPRVARRQLLPVFRRVADEARRGAPAR